jgi:ribonucleases P/MRP protein subunit RPP25
MEAYHKVQKKKEETAENEIRVAVAGQVSSYLGYAFRILNKSEHKSLTIRATGNAIVKALILIELVKRRIGDLHQLNKIHSMVIVDVYKPKVEGLEPIEQNRRVTALDCILSKEPLENQVGYQEPEPKEERVQMPPKRQNKEKPQQRPEKTGQPANEQKGEEKTARRGGGERGGRGRGRGRGGADKPELDEGHKPQRDRDSSPAGTRGRRGMRGGERGAARGGTRGGPKRYNDDFDIQ